MAHDVTRYYTGSLRHTDYNDYGLVNVSFLGLSEQASAPTNITNYGQLYTKSDNELYFLDGDGATAKLLKSTGGSITGDLFVSGVLGLGTTAVPHASIGYAKFAIEGAAANAAGPHIQITVDTNNYPTFQLLSWSHDFIAMLFDAYYDGAYNSSDPGSNFMVRKQSDVLAFAAETGIAAGSSATFLTAFQIEADAEVLFSPTADRKLYFRDSAIYLHSAADGYLDIVADTAVRLSSTLYLGADDTTAGVLYLYGGATTTSELRLYHPANADGEVEYWKFYTSSSSFLLVGVPAGATTFPTIALTDDECKLYQNRTGLVGWTIQNTNTATGGATLFLSVNSSSSGDAYTWYTVGATQWRTGIDNSDSDKYKIHNTALADVSLFELDTSGNLLLTSGKYYVRDTALYVGSNADGYLDLVADTGIRFGDGGTTNYTQVEPDGALVFVGEAGLAFAEIWVRANSTASTISGAGTYVQFLYFDTNGQSNNCTPDHTNDHITIVKAGRYFVTASLHIESIGAGGADEAAFEVRKNNGTTIFNNLHAHRQLAGGGGDVGSVSISGIIDLAANDTIELWVANESSTDDILVEDANLTVIQLAGT